MVQMAELPTAESFYIIIKQKSKLKQREVKPRVSVYLQPIGLLLHTHIFPQLIAV